MRIGLLGHGVVGCGVADILLHSADHIKDRSGVTLELVGIADLKDFSHLPYAALFCKEGMDLAVREDVDIFIECMGGTRAARRMVLAALDCGKHVVTSNKALVAACGEELAAKAKEKGVRFLYEASTGGGIPVLQPLRQCLAANRLDKIAGILNGTTNYILSRMKDGGVSFAVALKEAQSKGYAEHDPTDDVEGADTRRKICILAHDAFGAKFDDSAIFTQGITTLSKEDMLYARELGRSLKLLAVATLEGEGWRASVAPAMLPEDHILAGVNDVFNAVFAHGDRVDDVLFYGRGAGEQPTASAIVGDCLDIALHPQDPPLYLSRDLVALPSLGGETRLFGRVTVPATDENRRAVEKAFPGARFVQLEGPAFADEFGFVTAEEGEEGLRARFDALPLPHGAAIRYMVP